MRSKRNESTQDLPSTATIASADVAIVVETVDSRHQALAAFQKCDECDCLGFRLADGSLADLTRRDVAELTGVVQSTFACTACRHTMSSHLDAVRSLTIDERAVRTQMLHNYVFLRDYVEKYSSCDELQRLRDNVFPQLRDLLNASARVHSTELPLWRTAEPPFESASVRKMIVALTQNMSTQRHLRAADAAAMCGRVADAPLAAAIAQFERNVVKRRKFDESAVHRSIAEREAEENKISVHVITNDLCDAQPNRKLAWLMQLQRLFCAQLPKMPEEYVTRVVFDREHRSLVIHKEGKGIIGGICYRSFQKQGFIEVVFCAITADEQVKGYGTLMMNHLKDYQVHKCGIFHLLTYADEFAIGYFKKQGFITQIAMPVEQFRGYIKDYQGATLMGCQLHPRIMYTRQKELFYNMRDLYTCLLKAKHPTAETKFGGIEHIFQEHDREVLDTALIPGFATLRENGAAARLPPPTASDSTATYRAVLAKLRADKNAWPFLAPVNADEVPEYYDTIGYPIDLRTMGERVKAGYYVHERLFLADMKRMFGSCYKFNAPESPYYMHGYRLNQTFNHLAEVHFPGVELRAELPAQRPLTGEPTGGKASKRH